MPVETVDRLAHRARRRGGAGLGPMSTASSLGCSRPGEAATGSTKRCATPRSAAESGFGRCSPSRRRACSRSTGARASRRLRDRGDPRLFADPRRSALHGRCRPQARQADGAQGLWRSDGRAGGGQPPCTGVRDPGRSGDTRRPLGPFRLVSSLRAPPGPAGMAGGQMMDLAAEGRELDLPRDHPAAAAEDRRADRICGRGGVHHGPSCRRRPARPIAAMPATSGSPSRSPTI